MADAHAPVSFMRRGAIAQGGLVHVPAALLPVEWRTSGRRTQRSTPKAILATLSGRQ